eukprot:1960925-Rhodomonas_salina.1
MLVGSLLRSEPFLSGMLTDLRGSRWVQGAARQDQGCDRERARTEARGGQRRQVPFSLPFPFLSMRALNSKECSLCELRAGNSEACMRCSWRCIDDESSVCLRAGQAEAVLGGQELGSVDAGTAAEDSLGPGR